MHWLVPGVIRLGRAHAGAVPHYDLEASSLGSRRVPLQITNPQYKSPSLTLLQLCKTLQFIQNLKLTHRLIIMAPLQVGDKLPEGVKFE